MSDMPDRIYVAAWSDSHGWIQEWDEDTMTDSAAADCDGFVETEYVHARLLAEKEAEVAWLRKRLREVNDEAFDYAEQIEQLKKESPHA